MSAGIAGQIGPLQLLGYGTRNSCDVMPIDLFADLTDGVNNPGIAGQGGKVPGLGT